MRVPVLTIVAVFGVTPMVASPLIAQAPFAIGGVTAAPGATASGAIEIPPAAGDRGTSIPFTVVNGVRPGPVLALVAGTHGMEYPPSSRHSGSGTGSIRRP
jgi:hypothetical protein